MKKTLRVILITLLIAVLAFGFVACKDEADEGTPQETPAVPSGPNEPQQSGEPQQPSGPVQPAVTMTESYREGREQFHAIMGIWLPELEACEDVFSWFDTDDQSLRFDFSGDEEVIASLKDFLIAAIGNPNNEDQYGVYWEYDGVVNGKEAKINVEIGKYTEDGRDVISIHGFVRNYYNVTLTGTAGGSVILKMGSRTFDNNVAKVNAGDNLILTATPDENYQFVGWYDGETLVSENNPCSPYRAPAKNIAIQGKFEAVPASTMTASYAQARTSFQTVSGLLLPTLSEVSGMYEDLGANMWMVDIGNATQDALTSVIAAFDTQTSSVSTIDEFGKNVWRYTRSDNDAVCELSAFYNEGIVVIMYEEKRMSPSYAASREAFFGATGVTLPAIVDLNGDISFGGTYLMFDIVDGDNLTHDTYERFLSYFNELNGWSGQEDEHSSEEYPTYVYENATSGVSFQVVWNGESESGGIYLNAFNTLSTFDKYSAAKSHCYARFEIDLPETDDVSAEFSCAADATWMTLDLTKEGGFTETEYGLFVSALSAKLGNGTDESDEYQKRTTWTVDGALWDVTWDLGTGLAVNFG